MAAKEGRQTQADADTEHGADRTLQGFQRRVAARPRVGEDEERRQDCPEPAFARDELAERHGERRGNGDLQRRAQGRIGPSKLRALPGRSVGRRNGRLGRDGGCLDDDLLQSPARPVQRRHSSDGFLKERIGTLLQAQGGQGQALRIAQPKCCHQSRRRRRLARKNDGAFGGHMQVEQRDGHRFGNPALGFGLRTGRQKARCHQHRFAQPGDHPFGPPSAGGVKRSARRMVSR